MKLLLAILLIGISKQSLSQVHCSNSIVYEKDSLYLVNGKRWAGAGSPLKTIPVENIIKIECIPAADATAIYGSKGALGAELITTKKANLANKNKSICKD